MGFPSLVYMYANIMNSYNSTSSLPNSILTTPWITITNPNQIYDYQTQKTFNTIQSAIDDPSTNPGDTIAIGIPNISANIIVDKPVFITSVTGVNVTVTAANSTKPVFEIINTGSSSTITNLIIANCNHHTWNIHI